MQHHSESPKTPKLDFVIRLQRWAPIGTKGIIVVGIWKSVYAVECGCIGCVTLITCIESIALEFYHHDCGVDSISLGKVPGPQSIGRTKQVQWLPKVSITLHSNESRKVDGTYHARSMFAHHLSLQIVHAVSESSY